MATRKQTNQKKARSLRDLVPVIEQHKANIAQDAKEIVRAELQPIFDEYPEIDGVRWCQLSTFNAGETDNLIPELYIDDIQYRLGSHVAGRSAPYNDAHLFDSGFDRQDTDWICPWNDRRIEDAHLLDSLTQFEEKLFNSQNSLAMAFGDNRVTVTRKSVTLDPVPEAQM